MTDALMTQIQFSPEDNVFPAPDKSGPPSYTAITCYSVIARYGNLLMPDIRVVLVTLDWKSEHLDTLKAALAPADVICANRFDALRITSALRRADVALLSSDIDERFLRAPNLRWVHCDHSGLERSSFPQVFEGKLIVTSASGRSAPALAEHAIFFMLALSFRYGEFYKAQLAHSWGVSGQRDLRALHGQTLGIVGLGHTGTELAKLAKSFGMHVIGYRRRSEKPPQVDKLYSSNRGESLDALLQQSDYIVLALPLSDQSYRLIGERELALMRPSAHLINIARGGLVDEQALVNALQEGRIAGAAVDVVDEEPLPHHSALWSAPNLLITPHVTPQLDDREKRSLGILLDNVDRYRKGEPMLNQLMPNDKFSQPARQVATKSRSGSRGLRMKRFARRVAHWWRIR